MADVRSANARALRSRGALANCASVYHMLDAIGASPQPIAPMRHCLGAKQLQGVPCVLKLDPISSKPPSKERSHGPPERN
jgi:hypothetical protein